MNNTTGNDTLPVRPFNRYQIGAAIISPVAVTNLAVVIMILSKSSLRTVTNIIICSSCVSALLFALMLIIAAIVTSVSTVGVHLFFLRCIYNHAVELTLGGIFSFHITAISLERFFSVIYPFRYQRFANVRNTSVVLVAVWLLPVILIYLPSFIASWIVNQRCFPWPKHIINVFFYILFPIIIFLPPIVISITYIIMIYKISSITSKSWLLRTSGRLSASAMASNGNTILLTTSNPLVSNKTETSHHSKSRQRALRNRKPLLQMLLLVGIYSLTLFPFYFLFLLLIETNDEQKFRVPLYVSYLVTIGYLLVHPILSVVFTSAIKKECLKTWRNVRLNSCWCSSRLRQVGDAQISSSLAISPAVHLTHQGSFKT
ncbi:Octopamine receptor beta-2R [Trichoplax sp. H2]|nr:Octopamine receptor beta-2R [Trichoplax sp. H2]|eukprot:RDD37318.1 Octopamine receptor beta-2R [Trichoplax sp. H2]